MTRNLFGKFEETLEEYLDRYWSPEVAAGDVIEFRKLVMDFLEEEYSSLPRIRKYRSSVQEPVRVECCMFEIYQAIAHRSNRRKISEGEAALSYLISRIIFSMALATKVPMH